MHTMILASDIVGALEIIRSTVVSAKIGGILHVGTALAALLCALSLLKISNDYLAGKGIDAWTVLRPLVILALCANFNTLVATPLHGIVNVFTTSMRNSVKSAEESNMKVLNQVFKKMYDNSPSIAWGKTMTDMMGDGINTSWSQEVEESSNNKGWFSNLCTSAMNWILKDAKYRLNKVTFKASLCLFYAVSALLILLGKIAYFCIQVYCYFYLIMLMLVGPLVFAFGILDSFRNGIQMWVAKYIQTCFWIPVGQLVLWVNATIMKNMVDVIIQSGYIGGAEVAMFGLAIVSLLNLFAIPSLANMIVESSGVGGAEDKASGIVKQFIH